MVDPQTDGILLYVETVGDARRFISALRAAARTKPVVVLRAGRSLEPAVGDAPVARRGVRCRDEARGTVRVKTYTQLFAAARILAMDRISRGDQLAIVTNGHGPGTLAADSAADRGVPLAEFSPETEEALAEMLPPNIVCGNPVNVRGDAPPARSPRPSRRRSPIPTSTPCSCCTCRGRSPARPTRRARSRRSRGARPSRCSAPGSARSSGARLPPRSRRAASPNFYTPENAVDAFSFLAAYRHNQEWLLEVPPSAARAAAAGLAAVERIRDDAASADRRVLTEMETHALLAAFGLPVAPASPPTRWRKRWRRRGAGLSR